jgi:hypothetical protein
MKTALSIVKARVAGETKSIDAAQIKHLAELDDADERAILELANVGKLKFTKTSCDYTSKGKLEWISFYAKVSGITYALTLNYRAGKFASYECDAHPSNMRRRENNNTKKFKATGDSISMSAIEDAFNMLKPAARAMFKDSFKTPASFNLGPFNMIKKKRDDTHEFVSDTKDSEDKPMVEIGIDKYKNNVCWFFLNGDMADGEDPFDLTECDNDTIVDLLEKPAANFDEMLKAITSNKSIMSKLAKLKPKRGIDERIMQLNVQHTSPLPADALNSPSEYIDDDGFMHVIFKDAETRNTVLDTLRKLIKDNGGRIMSEKDWKPTP